MSVVTCFQVADVLMLRDVVTRVLLQLRTKFGVSRSGSIVIMSMSGSPIVSRMCRVLCRSCREPLSLPLFTRSVNGFDTIRYAIFTCAQKLTNNQFDLPHATKQKRAVKKLKTKIRDAQKKRSSNKVCGVRSEARTESVAGKICERGRS